ncbi:MAG: hypothetical protein IJ557_02335 [Bacteroidaceae bacterium]|nr:hypothetical protein [Bacteroidaceae bacterium]
MKRFDFFIRLSDGVSEIHARAIGETAEEALDQLQKQKEYVEFVGEKTVAEVKLMGVSDVNDIKAGRFNLSPSMQEEGWWVVADTQRNVVVRFQEHAFNATYKATPLNDDYPALELATSLREIGEYVATYYPYLL